jgi:hypothetical protein
MTLTPLHAAARRVALTTAAVLLVPAVAMQVTDEVSWGPGDFVVAAGLLFGAGMTYALAAQRTTHRSRRLAIAAAVGAVVAVIWAELAVGLFH